MYRGHISYDSMDKGQQLLQCRETIRCNQDEEIFEHTSFVAGIFYLKKGDEVFVQVSDVTLVHGDVKATVFGLYML